MENLFSYAHYQHLLPMPLPQLAPWDQQAGTVPYNVNKSTTATVSSRNLADYWCYDAVSVSDPDIF